MIAHVASVTAAGPGSDTITSGAINTTGADLVVVEVSWYTGTTASPTLSDSKSNTWTGLTQQTNNSRASRLFYCAGATVGTGHTFTLAGSVLFGVISAVAVSGAHAAPFASENGVSVGFANSGQPGSVTPPEDGCLVVTGLTLEHASSATGVDGGFTAAFTELGSDNIGGGLAWLVQATAAAVNPTWSWSGGGSSFASTIAAFKPAAAIDTTPPTLSSLAINTAGTSLTATLSESGCLPASGTGGFTLAGTSATVASWAISGTTLTLTLAGTAYAGQTVTASYSRAATTDDIHDAATAPNYLADFSAAAVTNNSTVAVPLAAGTASFVTSGPSGISVSATAPTNGSGAGPTYQWERNADGGSYGDLSGETGLTCDDATATTTGVLYGYRCKQTRGSETVATNAVTAEVYPGGALGATGPIYAIRAGSSVLLVRNS